MRFNHRRRLWRLVLAVTVTLLVGVARSEAITVGPSAHCHVTDGTFTLCPDGTMEWSDITFLPFGIGLGAADVYTDQGPLSPSASALFLMYDLIGPRAPLGLSEHADIRFDVSEGGVLENYLVQCFGDESVLVFVDGVPSPPEGIECKVGGGPTANSFFDVFVELEVPLNVVYSPDIPLFWSASAPPPQPCPPEQPQCHPSGGTASSDPNVPVSATITFASSGGTTIVIPVPPTGVTLAQLCDRATGTGILLDLADGVLPPTGTYKNHGTYVSMVDMLTKEALDSLVHSQVIAASDAGALHGCVVSQKAMTGVGK